MKKVRVFGIIALICGVIGVTFLMDIPTWLKIRSGDIKDFELVAAGELQKGDAVSGIVDMSLGPCAEEYSTSYGIRTSDKSTKLYYVLWMNNDKFILYETGNSSEYNTLDRITDETFDYFESLANAEESGDTADVIPPVTTMKLEGIVTNTPSNIQGYFKEWYDEAFGDGEFNSSVETVMIQRTSFDRFGTTIYIGIGAAVLCIVMLVLTILSWRKEKRDQQFGY